MEHTDIISPLYSYYHITMVSIDRMLPSPSSPSFCLSPSLTHTYQHILIDAWAGILSRGVFRNTVTRYFDILKAALLPFFGDGLSDSYRFHDPNTSVTMHDTTLKFHLSW